MTRSRKRMSVLAGEYAWLSVVAGEPFRQARWWTGTAFDAADVRGGGLIQHRWLLVDRVRAPRGAVACASVSGRARTQAMLA